MNPDVLARAVRELGSKLEIRWNRRRGRSFVPDREGQLFIETSSICNLDCRFCAYPKKASPRVSMSNSMFFDCVEQATPLGFDNLKLTPCTGDVFMDRRLFEKLEFLDRHPGVRQYGFYTNLTLPEPEDIPRLLGLGKLVDLGVSVYGHDLASFEAITGAREKVYRRLVRNLEALLAAAPGSRCQVELMLRTGRRGFRQKESEIHRILDRFRSAGVRVRSGRVYNNWGGYVTAADVAGLDMDLTDASATYKNGACVLLFTSIQVLANGVVNGCACRDVDATLRIGDVRETPLSEILSPANPAWRRLIEEQQRGAFREVCRACDYYRSIYHMRTEYRRNRRATQTLEQYLRTASSDGTP